MSFFIENLFLIILALIWIIIAVVMDIRKREVANWLNFSLIAIALSYRAFVSLWLQDYRFFIYGLAGFAIFFGLANLFYYSRIFAGGDAKLLMGLGAVLPFSSSIYNNFVIFLYFTVLLLFCGGIYGLIYSVFMAIKNKKIFIKEFKEYFEKNKKFVHIFFILSIVLAILVLFFTEEILLILPLLLMTFPLLYIYAKAVEEASMVKFVSPSELTIGDWLYEDIKIGKKKIKPNWEGLNESELKLLQKRKEKVKIKQGIPFTPAFLLAFLILIWLLV